MINKLFKQSVLATIAKAAAAAVALAFNLMVASVYQAGEAADSLLTITFLVITSVGFRFGSDQFIVRLIARKGGLTAQSKGIVVSLNSLILILASVLVAVLLVVGLIYPVFPLDKALLLLCSVLFYSLTQVNSFCLQGLKRPLVHIYFLNAGFFTLLLLGHLLFYVISVYSVEGFSFGVFLRILAACTFFNYILSYLVVRIGFSHNIRFSRIASIFKVNLGYYLFSLLQATLVWLPQIILYFSIFKDQVAVYTLMHRLALLAGFVLISISSVFTPRFAKNIKAKCFEKVERDARFFIKLASSFSLVFVTALAITIEPLLYAVDKTDLLDKRVMWVLFVAQVINALTGPSLRILQMGGQITTARRTQFKVAIFSLIAGLLLINTYGALGAAIVCASVIISANISYTIAAIRKFDLNIYRGLIFKSR